MVSAPMSWMRDDAGFGFILTEQYVDVQFGHLFGYPAVAFKLRLRFRHGVRLLVVVAHHLVDAL